MNAFSRLTVCVAGLLLLIGAVSPVGGAQTFVQLNYGTPNSMAQVGVVYTQAQTAGNLNVVVVGWSDATSAISSVTDNKGNVYALAVGPTQNAGGVTQAIYYAKNIVSAAAGANTVTVRFNTTASFPDIRIMEYSGLDLNNPLDGVSGAVGTTSTMDSGAVVTTNGNDLLVGANTVLTRVNSAGTGYTNRVITYPDGDLVEDEIATGVGTYHATSTLADPGAWVMQVVALKAAGATPTPTAPSNLAASVVSNSQINLSWTASTETGGTVASYLVEQCGGVGCTNFAQVGTSTTTTYSDTGLASGSSYSYRVRAKDTANNVSLYSNVATGVTTGTAVPTAPSNLVGVAGAPGPVVVATQGYINSTSQTVHTTLAFDSTGGDLVVLCASSHAGVTMTPTDSFGNSWLVAAGPTSTTVGNDLRTGVWYARMPVVGTGHTVTMTLSGAQPLVMSVIVVKGSNTTNPLDVVSGIGNDGGTQSVAVSSPNVTTTAGNELLIGFAKSSFSETWTAGSGYTGQLSASSAYLYAETGKSGAAGTYSATFTMNAATTWQAAVVAVSPSAAASAVNQVNLTWGASTETGGTIASYLVERCQGVGCTGFAQIGTSTSQTYNDSAVTTGSTYSYRVRALDNFNNPGPYSITVNVSTGP